MATSPSITIEFKPKGDKQLIASIKQLDIATKRLKGTVSIYEKEIEATERAHRKLNRQMKRLNTETLFGVKNQRLLSNSFATIRSKLLLYSFAIGLTTMAFRKLSEASIEQEKVEKKLAHQLGRTSKSLLNYASGLQAVTKFGDEAIIGVQGMLAAFTKDEEQIKLATQATLDLAEAKGMDLKTAGDLVSKTLGSSTNALSRYGIEVTGSANSVLRLESLTRNISTLFAGEATSAANTFGGQVTQMSNAIGDANESMGTFFQPILEKVVKFLKNGADATKEFFSSLQETEMETMIRKFEELGVSAEALKGMKDFQLTKDLEDINAQLDATGKGFKTISEVETAMAESTAKLETSATATSKAVKERSSDMKKLEALNIALNKAEEDGLHFTKDREKIIKVINKETEKEIKMTLQQAIESQMSLKNITEKDAKIKQANKSTEKSLEIVKKEGVNFAAIIELMKKRNALQDELNDKGNDDPTFKLTLEDIQMYTERFSSHIMNVANAYNAQRQASLNASKATALAATDSIRSERLKGRKINEINEEYAAKQAALNRETKKTKRAQTVVNTAVSLMEIWSDDTVKLSGKIIMSALVAELGRQQLKTIDAQKYQYGGMVGGNRHSQGGTMIEAERGEYVVSRRGVESAGIEALNRINAGGGSGSVNISFNGNVLSKDFIEDEAIPQIKEAIRRGADIGIG